MNLRLELGDLDPSWKLTHIYEGQVFKNKTKVEGGRGPKWFKINTYIFYDA